MSFQSPIEVDPRGFDLIRRRLAVEADLHAADIALIEHACAPVSSRAAGTDLTLEPGPLFLTAGWACRVRELGGHGRQILGFVLPGDPIGVPDGGLAAPHRTLALTRVSLLDGQALAGAVLSDPAAHRGLAAALDGAARAECHRHLDHAVRLGALDAYQAMRHFLTELHDRLEAVGLAHAGRFDLPVAQDVLGSALGVSEVHANRVLAQLRRDGLLELGPGWALLVDRA